MNHLDLDTAFDSLAALVRDSFSTAIANGGGHLFKTDAKHLFDVYLASFDDPVERQHHNCNCCHSFIKRFGGLVWITKDGRTVPAMWGMDLAALPLIFYKAARDLCRVVSSAKITGVFQHPDRVWGTPEAGGWNHFAVTPPVSAVYTGRGQTARQKMAQQREDFELLLAGLQEFEPPVFDAAAALASSGQLNKSSKFAPILTALRDLRTVAFSQPRQAQRDTFLWYAVASSPSGFAHVKNSAIGTLLTDLQSGIPLDAVKRKFAAVTADDTYQKPTAPVSAGNIAQAEDLVAKLGLAASLPRRLATLSEVIDQAFWLPQQTQSKRKAVQTGGVFASLSSSATSSPVSAGRVSITWDKFLRTVLPTAQQITFAPPATSLPYGGLTTAEDQTSPTLFKWPGHLSWYRWAGASRGDFFLGANPVDVLGVVPLPSPLHSGHAVLLRGALDTHLDQAGSGLFPEALHSDFFAVRATLYAHSSKAVLRVPTEDHPAFGLIIRKDSPINITFRVFSHGSAVDYHIDRWD